MSRESALSSPKLPFWRTLGESYALWFRNLPELVRISWLWFAVMAPVFAVIYWWQAPHFIELMNSELAGGADPDPLFTAFMQLVGTLMMLPLGASIAVAWHRLLLRDERAGTSAYFRFDSLVIGYAVLFFLISLLPTAPQLIAQSFAVPDPEEPGTSMPDFILYGGLSFLLTIVSIIGLLIAGRLFVILPARALGRDDITLGVVWAVTRKNTWRMFWGYILSFLPVGIVTGALMFWYGAFGASRLGLTLVWMAATFLWIAGAMIGVGFLSLAYRHFFERGGAAR